MHQACNRKCQTALHTGGQLFKRPVLKILEFCKFDDLVVHIIHEFARIAQQCAAQIGIFAHGQITIEAAGQFQQGCNGAVHFNTPLCRHHDAGYRLEQRGFAGAVRANNAEHIAAFKFKRYILVRPELRNAILALQLAHDVVL